MRKLFIVVVGLLAILLGLVLVLVLTFDPDDYREEIAARASETLGREVQLEGPISLRLFPWLALNIQDVAVGNPPGFETAPMFARVGEAAVAVRLMPLLRDQLEIGTVSLSDAHLAIVTDRLGQSNLDGLLAGDAPRGADHAPPDLSRLSLGRLQLNNITVEQLDLGSGERTLLQLERLELDPFRAGQSVPVSLRGRVSDGAVALVNDLALDGRVRVATDLASIALENWQARMALPGAGAAVRAEGELELELGGDAPLLVLPSLRARVDAADQDLRFELRQPLRLLLDDSPSAELLAASLSLNGQALDLAGSFRLGDPISAELEVSGRRLDLRPLIPAGGEPGSAPTEGTGDFSALVGPSLGLALRLDELIMSDGLTLTAVDARAGLRDGRLLLEPLQANLFGGSFGGNATVDFTVSPPLVRVNPSLAGIQAEQVAGLLSNTAPLRGLGEMNLDFRFSGLSVGEILSSLDGQGSFRLDDGALLGVDLRRLIDERLSVSSLVNINESFGGETPFRSLAGNLRAESGVIFLPDMNLQAADFGASGQGRVDFAAGQVAYQLDLRLGEELTQRLPRQLSRATGGVIPLAIVGPLNRPAVQVDVAALAEGTIRRELQDRLLDRLRPSEPEEPEPSSQEAQESTSGESSSSRAERSSDRLIRALRERDREPPRPEDAEPDPAPADPEDVDEPPPEV